MQIQVTRLDILRTRASWPDTEFRPAYVVARQNGDSRNWRAADSPLPTADGKAKVTWALADTDEYIRIPLFSYDISPKGDLALAFMFQLGVTAACEFKGNVAALHMVVGMPAELVYAPDGTPATLNYWFGFALAS